MEFKWFFFIDIVGSSNPNITSSKQINKIEKLIEIIKKNLDKKDDLYKSFTGDGMLIVFSNYEDTLDLTMNVCEQIREYNKSLKKDIINIDYLSVIQDELHVRIGIGAGTPSYFDDGVHNQKAPWGVNLILTKRIMDLANEDQILVSDLAYQLIRDLDNDVKYKNYLIDMGEAYIKHQTKGEKVYSFYKKDHFGNNLRVNKNFDIPKLLSSIEVENKLRKPLLRFCEKRAENTIYNLKGIMSEDGLELSNITTDLLYEVLFRESERYIAASFLPPGEFWDAHNCGNPYNLLNYHADLIRRAENQGLCDKHYRFLIMPKERLKIDKNENPISSLQFVKWHTRHNVNLYLVDPIEFGNLFSKRHTLVTDTGIGLCYDLCILQFGLLEKYVNEKYKNNPVVKRRFWLSASESDSYLEGVSLFEDLKKLAESKKIIAIDQDYFHNL